MRQKIDWTKIQSHNDLISEWDRQWPNHLFRTLNNLYIFSPPTGQVIALLRRWIYICFCSSGTHTCQNWLQLRSFVDANYYEFIRHATIRNFEQQPRYESIEALWPQHCVSLLSMLLSACRPRGQDKTKIYFDWSPCWTIDGKNKIMIKYISNNRVLESILFIRVMSCKKHVSATLACMAFIFTLTELKRFEKGSKEIRSWNCSMDSCSISVVHIRLPQKNKVGKCFKYDWCCSQAALSRFMNLPGAKCRTFVFNWSAIPLNKHFLMILPMSA